MNAPTPDLRRGACPALSAPMQTGDGLLVRLNLAEGGLSPATLAALCDAAARHGNGLVEITARGSFQIRGLTPASAPLLAADVNAMTMQMREGVPVETSPLSGLDPKEIADPLPLVREIRTAVEREGLSQRLGPKVSVVVDGGGQISLRSILADVRVTAAPEGWNVSIGGSRPHLATDPANAADMVLAFLSKIAALGLAARGRDLRETAVEASEQGDAERPEQAHLGLLALRNGRCATAIALPFGQCAASTLLRLALSTPGITDFRFAPGRRLLALGDRAACEALQENAADLGFLTQNDDPRRLVAACAGAPACATGLLDAKALGARAAGLLPAQFAGTVHVSGCAKGCAHPGPAEAVLVGTPAGIALMRHAKASDTASLPTTDPDAALDLLKALLERPAA